MATFLQRIGRFSYRRRILVLSLWLVVLAALGGAAGAFSGKTSDEFRVPGTEAQATMDKISGALPQYADSSGQVVFAAEPGERLDPAKVAPAVQAIGKVEGVTGVLDPFKAHAVSKDGRIAFAQVTFDRKTDDLSEATRQAVKDASHVPGVQVEYGGDAFQPSVEVGGGEVIGVGVAVLVLLITFGTLIAAGLPLLSAIVGVGVSITALMALTGRFEIISTAPVLAVMIGMAVGIDYALFIVSRHLQNLRNGMAPEDAAALANGTAGSAVIFAGGTVVVALAGLTVAGVPFLTAMGLSAAGAVVVAMLVAVTLLPALLGFAGRRVERLRIPGLRIPGLRIPGLRLPGLRLPGLRLPGLSRRQRGEDGSNTGNAGERWARFVVRRPWAVLVAGLSVLGVLAIPATDLRLGLPSGGSYAEGTSPRKAYDLISDGFGPGFNGPLLAVTDVRNAQPVAQKLATMPDVATILEPSTSGDTAVITVIPKGGPNDESTEDLVSSIRDLPDVSVTGTAAANIDISKKLGDALPPFLAVVVGISLLLLALAFRSILVPITAIAGFLLSIAASTGAVVAVYQWGWLTEIFPVTKVGPIASFLPILLIGVLFGLAMDYQLFLVSRMKEEHAHGADPRTAVVTGFGNGARVVTAAALIMISVFGSFAFGHDPGVQPIGFALAVGVLVDAFLVRMALVPAVMALLGRAAWWFPRSLERAVPNVDMEGTALERDVDRQPELASR
ncbi:MMPL family transporter [Actinomadura barringtoniae]|uniref:MMPL family transporter n=1 Tax=Actinomadura barringtoniae TaxID=1427535 RepID=A0A939P6K6_9ACTN|nr:MMPL family transporter [Actinomadura barringtoniae]MBO2446456.1 MMPL family transporter [Actinomadura barringtoniae]